MFVSGFWKRRKKYAINYYALWAFSGICSAAALAVDSREPALFRAFSAAKEKIPYTPLAALSTPVIKADKLGGQFKHNNLYIKNDCVTGDEKTFGGNKPR